MIKDQKFENQFLANASQNNRPYSKFPHCDIVGTRLTRVVADSGAGSTIETFRNSELIFAIFKNFALKFSELTSIKVLENKA